MIRTLLVYQHHLIGDVIATILQDKPAIEIVGCVTTVDRALTRLADQVCDIVVVGGGVSNQGIMQIMDFIHYNNYETKVLITDIVNSQPIILHYLEEGVHGYVHEDEPLESLVEKINALARGEFPVPPAIAAALIARIKELKRFVSLEREDEAPNPLTSLTLREREVVQLIALGYTNQEIANQLFIEVGTVKNHVHSIFRKFGIQKREEAIFFAQQLNMPAGYLSLPMETVATGR